MRIALERVSRRPGWSGAAVVVVAGWLAAVAAVTWWGHRTHHSVTLCPLKAVTGVPCAGCGSTRAGLALLRGDPAAAAAWNPLATVVFCLLGASAVLRLAGGRRVCIQWTPRQRGIALAAGAGLILANWAYVFLHAGGGG